MQRETSDRFHEKSGGTPLKNEEFFSYLLLAVAFTSWHRQLVNFQNRAT
jgi:hypothetical protein